MGNPERFKYILGGLPWIFDLALVTLKEANLSRKRHIGPFFTTFSLHSPHWRGVFPPFHFFTFKNGLLSLITLVTLNIVSPHILGVKCYHIATHENDQLQNTQLHIGVKRLLVFMNSDFDFQCERWAPSGLQSVITFNWILNCPIRLYSTSTNLGSDWCPRLISGYSSWYILQTKPCASQDIGVLAEQIEKQIQLYSD